MSYNIKKGSGKERLHENLVVFWDMIDHDFYFDYIFSTQMKIELVIRL